MGILELQKHWEGFGFCQLEGGVVVGIIPFMFTVAIVSDVSPMQYYNRWCYHDLMGALGALKDWLEDDEMTEPTGWHRHLPSHRRVHETFCEVMA